MKTLKYVIYLNVTYLFFIFLSFTIMIHILYIFLYTFDCNIYKKKNQNKLN